MKYKHLILISLLSGCAASAENVGSLVLPTSNKTIDIVQHRSDSKECPTGVVIQTYDAQGNLIDSKMAQGNAFHCQMLGAAIEAGGVVGGASLIGRGIRHSGDVLVNEQYQSQSQKVDINKSPKMPVKKLR